MTTRFVRERIRSIGFAVRGIVRLLRTERNAWVHAAATMAVVAGGLFVGLSAIEWAVVVSAMTFVWGAEAFNTALEMLGDAVSTERVPQIGAAKDAAAGAVLIAAVGAAVVGALVFGPRVFEALTQLL